MPPPNGERRFIHKKIVGGIISIGSSLLPGGGIVKDIGRRIIGSLIPGRTETPTVHQVIPGGSNIIPGIISGIIGDGNGQECPTGTVFDPEGGFCVAPESPFGASRVGGDVMMGRFGPAQAPVEEQRFIARCEKGMVLGKDGLCYDHLPNRDRKYPRGRRPLLTGGDMRSISKARTAGNRLANAKQDLIAIGMLKPAGPRKKRRKTAPKVC